MATITEDYVSFEVAKLLCEKGFDWECETSYYISSKGCENAVSIGDFTKVRPWREALIAAPTHQMAMKWLRKKHNIYIGIHPDFPSNKDYKMCWCWSANILHENCISTKEYQCYIETYEEAVEAALKNSLENLI